MSMQSWKEEFYPEPANSFRGRQMSAEVAKEAALHSARKWEGFREENLIKHDLFIVGISKIGSNTEPGLEFNCTTCALCQLFRHNGAIRCDWCPLNHLEGGKECGERSAYEDALRTGKPYRLIGLLNQIALGVWEEWDAQE